MMSRSRYLRQADIDRVQELISQRRSGAPVGTRSEELVLAPALSLYAYRYAIMAV